MNLVTVQRSKIQGGPRCGDGSRGAVVVWRVRGSQLLSALHDDEDGLVLRPVETICSDSWSATASRTVWDA